MSALDNIKEKHWNDMSMLEFLVVQAENHEAVGNAEEAAAEYAALLARVSELEKALKPFAEIPCLENFDDDQLFDPAGGVYAADVRRARAALESRKP